MSRLNRAIGLILAASIILAVIFYKDEFNLFFDATKSVENAKRAENIKPAVAIESIEVVKPIRQISAFEAEQRWDEWVDWEQNQFGYYLTAVKPSDYSSYDIKTLEIMGDRGDLKALDMLAWRYRELFDRGSAVKTYHKAAVFGSTRALRKLGSLASRNVKYKKGVSTRQRMKYEAKLEFMYYQAAILRGDTDFLSTASIFIDVEKLELSVADKKFIQENGTAIYKQLEAERVKMGLGAFNAMPSSVKEHYTSISNRYKNLVTGESPLFLSASE